ncbi:5-formyltetrahydrofolate cyclo-ligase [Methanoplanus sp. FWC-SCC4]|uniref:5-formyltetrahydrofolate cyclo-ligase n=1 Tax=Methanochimaera problematica TaxID=2609417 RepID=A0AA97FET2_9EURY|nr:5-formyltetrahydrofolate cyclo-ligase [Methanoplanus sp. FWC-SCC4]WOF16116.1 5-formyltetrahydrofolate cyclo-ligase [Methanoplanus sp. FWC-SCC4]
MRELKNQTRDIMRQRREALTPEERKNKSETICRHVFNAIKPGETVMCFSSKEIEVNTTPLMEMLLSNDYPVVVPIIVKEDVSLRLSYIKSLDVLVPSTFGVPEPIGNEIPVPEGAVDIILLPMLGFDRNGGRLGYGAGYYDRFLEKNPEIKKIGIAFACQEAEKIPLEDNDVLMDIIITEDGIVYP